MLGNNSLCLAVLCLWLCSESQTSLDRSDHPFCRRKYMKFMHLMLVGVVVKGIERCRGEEWQMMLVS
jgi:hypothetical protein